MDVPFAKEGSQPAYLNQMKALFRRHPNTTIIWAHTGMGRVVRPINNHAAQLSEILADPQFSHIYFDISWNEVAKYVVAHSGVDSHYCRPAQSLPGPFPLRH